MQHLRDDEPSQEYKNLKKKNYVDWCGVRYGYKWKPTVAESLSRMLFN
jgi:hypothetical protein